MTSTFESRLYNIGAYITAPAITVFTWLILYVIMSNMREETAETATLFVRVTSTAFLLSLPLVIIGIVGAGLSLLLKSIVSQKILAVFAILFNLTLLAVFYLVLLGISLMSPHGLPRTEANLLFLFATGLFCLLYASFLCYKVWDEASLEEERVSDEANMFARRRTTESLQSTTDSRR